MYVIATNWWAFVLRGLLGVLFGILTFLMPHMALVTLVFMFGFYSIADGVFNIVSAVRRATSEHRRWGMLLLQGVIGIAAGFVALFIPGLTALALLYLIAAWAILTGATEIAAAVRLRKHIEGEWVLALSGVLSILLGAFLFFFPGPGALAVVLWIGAYAMVYGILLMVLGFRLRKLARGSAETGDAGFRGVAPSH
jgi:uncharacterized membrane protein HdeD (DUF308 family)